MSKEETLKKEKKDKDNQLKLKIKEKVFEHLSTTHLHGLPHIVRSKYWFMKIFWILFFLLMLGLSLWFIVLAYHNYYTYPVITSINKNVEQHTGFPAVIKHFYKTFEKRKVK